MTHHSITWPRDSSLTHHRWIRCLLVISVILIDVVLSDVTTVIFNTTEELPVGMYVGNLLTSAGFSQVYTPTQLSRIRFSIIDGTGLNYFSIQNQSGVIQIKTVINRDVICPSMVTCTLNFDVAISPADLFILVPVQVNIIDIGDYVPSFPVNSTTLSIPESVYPGTAFLIPMAVDLDSPAFGIQDYQLSGPGANELFSLRWRPGVSLQLVVNASLDSQPIRQFVLSISAVSGGPTTLTGTMQLDITVFDVNENSPVFDQTSYTVGVSEAATNGSVVFSVHASDADTDANGQVLYYWVAGLDGSGAAVLQSRVAQFAIDVNSGNVTLTGALDREIQSSYNLVVAAKDGGTPSLTSTASVTINIIDVNDNAPVITVNTLTGSGVGGSAVAQVSEGSNVGTFTALITVTDADTSRSVTCLVLSQQSMISDTFGLVAMSSGGRYKLVTLVKLDRETQPAYNVTISCSDNGQPPLSSSVPLTITVLDVNDNPPVFTDNGTYHVAIVENNIIGEFVVNVSATDSDDYYYYDGETQITYSVVGSSAAFFTIDPVKGTVSAAVSFDREETPQIIFNVMAVDNQGDPPALSSTATVIMTVLDVNDNSPQFVQPSYTFVVQEQQPGGASVGSVSATDPDSGIYGATRYLLNSATGSPFVVDPVTGHMTTSRPLVRSTEDKYCLVVSATNVGLPQLSSSVPVTVYVADAVSDNAIIIDFPTCGNNTVWVSSALIAGQQVTRVLAHDLNTPSIDNGASQLSFGLPSPTSPNGIFSIDATSGAIIANVNLAVFVNSAFALSVIVVDNAIAASPLSSTVNLTIIVNSSIAPPPLSPAAVTSSLTNRNLIIIASVVAASVVCTVILLSAIFYVVCRRRRRRTSRDAGSRKSGDNDDVTTSSDDVTRQIPAVVVPERRFSTVNSESFSSGFSSNRGVGSGGETGSTSKLPQQLSSYDDLDDGFANVTHHRASKRLAGSNLRVDVRESSRRSMAAVDVASSSSTDSGRGASEHNYNLTEQGPPFVRGLCSPESELARVKTTTLLTFHAGDRISDKYPTTAQSGSGTNAKEMTRTTSGSRKVPYVRTPTAQAAAHTNRLTSPWMLPNRDTITSAALYKAQIRAHSYGDLDLDGSLVDMNPAGSRLSRICGSSEVSDGGTSLTSGSYIILPDDAELLDGTSCPSFILV